MLVRTCPYCYASFLVANEVCTKMKCICLVLLFIFYHPLLNITKINYMLKWSNKQNIAHFWIASFPNQTNSSQGTDNIYNLLFIHKHFRNNFPLKHANIPRISILDQMVNLTNPKALFIQKNIATKTNHLGQHIGLKNGHKSESEWEETCTSTTSLKNIKYWLLTYRAKGTIYFSYLEKFLNK